MVTQHKQGQGRLKKAIRITIAGAVTNVALATIKIRVGYHTGYLALIADGVNSCSHLLSDFIALVTLKIGAR